MMWQSQALSILSASLVRPLPLVGCAFLVIRACRIRHPASLHAIWVFVLVATAILPFLAVSAPHLELRALPAEASPTPVRTGASARHTYVQATPTTSVSIPVPPPSIILDKDSDLNVIPSRSISDLPVGASLPGFPAPVPIRGVLLGIYGIGFAVVFSYFILGWVLLRRLVRNSADVRGNRILESNCVAVPVTAGVFHPVVVLPMDWRRWSRRVRRAVFAHEFAHLRRRDMWVSAFARSIRCIFWFQPLVWWLSRRISELAEMSCDVAALDIVRDAEEYALTLIEFAERAKARSHRSVLADLAMVRRSGLTRRIDMLLSVSNRTPGRVARCRWLLLLVIGIPVMLFASTIHLTRAAAKPFLQIQHAVGLPEKPPVATPLMQVPSSSIAALTPAVEATVFREPEPQQTAAETRAFLDKYCFRCHEKAVPTFWGPPLPRLDDKDLAQVAEDRELWEKVVRRLRTGIDPNVFAGTGRPDPADVRNVVRWLEAELDSNAPPAVGRAGRHPLNRTEYRNAVRDLLGLDIQTALILPSDDSVQGFDNLQEVLNDQSESKAAAYKAAAEKISVLGMQAPSRSFVMPCSPFAASEEAACVQRIIKTLATRAFRQPPSEEDIGALAEVYDASQRKSSPYFSDYRFERGIQAVLQNVLANPKFLNRIEVEPANLNAGETYRISDYELASRLSYFIWSRGPDDELLGLAARGQLDDPAVLEQQVHRMLKDSHSEALAVNFAGQWLSLRNLTTVGPFTGHPDFDEPLRQAMRRETELFFDSIVREDRNVVELLDANYTFLNERLARHYGIPNVSGEQFRRVTLDPAFDSRRGILGKASFLTVTSQPDRTSITKRGKWVLLHLLGVEAPPPPPNVPPLPNRDPAATNGPTFRQMMEESVSMRPDCQSCHRIMDPIGIALEPFDSIGMSRTRDAGLPVDPSTQLIDGTRLNGPADLRNTLLGCSDQFVQTLTIRLLTYGLGRTITYRDMPLVRSIVREAASENYRFSAIVVGIVKSFPFQMNIK